ncbi:MAG: 23S rRNA pseudouridine(1911/1915/1917) synthase RluD [Gammaproteobacteria bacterium]|nr:23S rRNA pseudouridine(1911/1915/1917) synthase RluD [Gammaproteobacteria bacterium]
MKFESFEIPDTLAGKRIDQAVTALLQDYSRSRIQQWLKAGYITLDGEVPRPREIVWGGETVDVQIQETGNAGSPDSWQAEDIPLDVAFEDESVIVINKPAGLVVHPGAGNQSGTLVNALLFHYPELAKLPRAGIIHRLDKDTTGLLVVARDLKAHHSLTQQLQDRAFTREYVALVHNVMTGGGTVDEPMGRHPVQRTKMAVLPHSQYAKEAITHYRVLEKFRAHTRVKVNLETGRTHRIRVHLSYINYPLVGDPLYGGRFRLPPQAADSLIKALQTFKRQALHARLLGFKHPVTGEYHEWSAEIPEDMQHLINELKTDLENHAE